MISRLSIALGLASLLPLSCREEQVAKAKPESPPPIKEEKSPEPERKPLINIPVGAVITDLTLPYFSGEKKPVSLLTIKELSVNKDQVLLDETLLSGITLKLWLFEKNGAIRSVTTIPSATYRMEKELIEANGEILMRDAADRFAAQASGGKFLLPSGQALLFGPAITRFDLPQKKKKSTAMNLRPLLPTAVLCQSLVADPPAISPEQLADFERKVAPRLIPDIDGRENFSRIQAVEQKITQRLAGFLSTIDETVLISEKTPAETIEPTEDPLKDLFNPGPESIVISCSKGIYLDGENREIVYLGQIQIEGQGMKMTCQRDLKAIFDEPPAPKPEKQKGKTDEEPAPQDEKKEVKNDPLSRFGGFGDLKQFTATGDVRLSGINEKGQKILLGGDRALYEMTAKEEQDDARVTMRGDQLAFLLETPKGKEQNGSTVAMRSISPDAWIVAEIKGKQISVRTSDDGWETVVISPKKRQE